MKLSELLAPAFSGLLIILFTGLPYPKEILDNAEIDFEKASPAAHKNLACSSCHTMIADLTASYSISALEKDRCQSCHNNMPESSADLPFHKNSKANCQNCHSFHDTKMLNVGDQLFTKQLVERAPIICQGCHNSSGNLDYLSEGHRQAAKLYHSNQFEAADISPSATCMSCHNRGSNFTNNNQSSGQAIHINGSASHPIGIKVASYLGRRLHLPSDSRTPLNQGRMECQTCHNLASGTKNFLASFNNPYDLCGQCHTQQSKL